MSNKRPGVPKNRVLWSEGTLLSQQHFQQQDRFYLNEFRQRLFAIQPNFWGFIHYSIDTDRLREGKVVLTTASGFMPDGTYFDLDDLEATHLAVNVEVANRSIFLCLPEVAGQLASERGELNLGPGKADAQKTPYTTITREVDDQLSSPNEGRKPTNMKLGALNLSLETGDSEALRPDAKFVGFKVAHVVSVGNDRRLELDPQFSPPVLHLDANVMLRRGVELVCELLRNRRDDLANTFVTMGANPATSIAQFMLLQTVNTFLASIQQLKNQDATSAGAVFWTHPYEAYRECVRLAAALAPLTERPARALRAYDHDRLGAIFTEVWDEIKAALEFEYTQDWDELELLEDEEARAIWLHEFDDRALPERDSFFLAARSDISDKEQFKSRVQTSINVVDPHQLGEVMSLGLGAVKTNPVERPPQFPALDQQGYQFFQIEKNSSNNEMNWERVCESNMIAIYSNFKFGKIEVRLFVLRKRS